MFRDALNGREGLEEKVMTRKNWPAITSAFAIGLGVGGILGLVLAPQSGEETRTLLRDKAQDGVDEAVAQGKKVARKAQRAADSATELVNEAVEAGEGAYREARNS
jgi:gas vesicle protein